MIPGERAFAYWRRWRLRSADNNSLTTGSNYKACDREAQPRTAAYDQISRHDAPAQSIRRTWVSAHPSRGPLPQMALRYSRLAGHARRTFLVLAKLMVALNNSQISSDKASRSLAAAGAA